MVSASSLLLLPSSVRDLASCVVADVAACTTPASTLTSSSSSSGALSVTVSYRSVTILPRRSSPLNLRLTWTRSPLGPTLSFSPSASAPAVLLRRRKGTRTVSLEDFAATAGAGPGCCSQVVVFWDLTVARYDASPEPHSGYYFVALAGADEVVLSVGDLAAEFVEERFEGRVPEAAVALSLPVARRERVVAPDPAAMHTVRRVQFAEGGPEHEVSVGCSGGGAEEELWVSVDGKRAVQAKRPRLNFRGNQTVFVDGAPVDVMWDLHGWWFRDPPAGCAVVMLRARSALESRLWLEEEEAAAAAPGFSLVVQAFKSRHDELSSAHR